MEEKSLIQTDLLIMTLSIYIIWHYYDCFRVESSLVSLGWSKVEDKLDDFKLKWVECKSQINYSTFKDGKKYITYWVGLGSTGVLKCLHQSAEQSTGCRLHCPVGLGIIEPCKIESVMLTYK